MNRRRRTKPYVTKLHRRAPMYTLAEIREEIQQLRQLWSSDPHDPWTLSTAHQRLVDLWNAALLIKNVPAPPLLPWWLAEPIADVKSATWALDDLTQWCESASPRKQGRGSLIKRLGRIFKVFHPPLITLKL